MNYNLLELEKKQILAKIVETKKLEKKDYKTFNLLKKFVTEELDNNLIKNLIGDQKKINILLQGRDDEAKGWSFATELKKSPLVDVKTVSTNSVGDIKITQKTTLKEILDALDGWKPNYYLVQMAEYRFIPQGIEEAPFPVFFQTNDTRSDYLTIASNVHLCDALLVLGDQPLRDLKKINDNKLVMCFPLFLGVDAVEAKKTKEKKLYDIGWSGHLVDESIYDKFNIISDIFSADKTYTKSLLVGKTSYEEYLQFLASCKLIPTYIQHDMDSVSSRAIEALAVGSCAIVPKGNFLGVFLDENHGLIESDVQSFPLTINRILKNYDSFYKNAAKNGQEEVLKIFDIQKATEKVAVFLEFIMAAVNWEKRIPIERWRSRFRIYDKIEGAEFQTNENARKNLRSENSYLLENISKEARNPIISIARYFQEWNLGNHEEAKKLSDNVCKEYPDSPHALFNNGIIRYQLNEIVPAEKNFWAVIENVDGLYWIEAPWINTDSSVFLERLLRDEIFEGNSKERLSIRAQQTIKSFCYLFLTEIAEITNRKQMSISLVEESVKACFWNFKALRKCAKILLDNKCEQAALQMYAASLNANRAYALEKNFRDEVAKLKNKNLLNQIENTISCFKKRNEKYKNKDFWNNIWKLKRVAN